MTSLQLFPLLWKAVGILEDNDLKVMAVTSDGTAANRTMYCMHFLRLAAQVLSSSVSITLKSFGPQETAGTALYCEMFDKFFDCFKCQELY